MRGYKRGDIVFAYGAGNRSVKWIGVVTYTESEKIWVKWLKVGDGSYWMEDPVLMMTEKMEFIGTMPGRVEWDV